MTALPGPDAREHPRARARIRVEYHFGSTTGSGYTTDISEGGLFLACDRTAQQGTRVYLRIHLPGSRAGDPLKIIGAVTRADRSLRALAEEPESQRGMGIHFEVAYSRTREALSDFIQGLLLQPAGAATLIQVLEGASETSPAFGVRLGLDSRDPMLSATEVESAFAFDTSQRERVEAPQTSATLFRVVVALVVVALAICAAMLWLGN